ncbi:MAG: PQQ-dependent sugar dehydrogenase [Pseudomonadota bacterium]
MAHRKQGGLGLLAAVLLLAASAHAEVQVETVADGFGQPWCIAFLPSGDMLITERGGALHRLEPSGERRPIDGVPPVFARSQGGLFDVLPAPDFATSQRLYLSYAHGDGKANALRVATATLVETALEDLTVVFEAAPLKDTPVHYGGRMAWLPDDTLLVTTGDGFDYREAAQGLDNHLGKTIRIDTDGKAPADNPFTGDPDALDEIWTYGHRNPQGIAVDPVTGHVFQHEHGPKGGDEVNRLVAGNNYGWPAISYGLDYNGAYVTPFVAYPGMEQPLLHWTPSIAPAGLAVYRGELFPGWNGNLLATALVEQSLRRVEVDASGKLVNQSVVVSGLGRLRDVRVAPDGSIYLLDESAGRILRLVPEGN